MNPYIANTGLEVRQMLNTIGVKSIDELFVDIQPRHRPRSFNIPKGKSEFEVTEHVFRLAAKNAAQLIPFIGAGYYDH